MIDAFEIESALDTLFLGNVGDKKFKAIDVQRGVTALTRPGLTWAVLGGKFSTENGMAEDVYETFEIIGTLVVTNVGSEKERRRAIHALVRYVTLKLLDNSLGLAMDGIKPKKWDETTTEKQLANGLMTVELAFSSKAQVVPEQTGEALRRLEAIWTTYTDPVDGQPLAESQANFEHGDTP